jgi:hypothetical protein
VLLNAALLKMKQGSNKTPTTSVMSKGVVFASSFRRSLVNSIITAVLLLTISIATTTVLVHSFQVSSPVNVRSRSTSSSFIVGSNKPSTSTFGIIMPCQLKRPTIGRVSSSCSSTTTTQMKETLYPWYTDPSLDRDRMQVAVEDLQIIGSGEADAEADNNDVYNNKKDSSRRVILYCNGKVCIIEHNNSNNNKGAECTEDDDEIITVPGPKPVLLSVKEVQALGQTMAEIHGGDTTTSDITMNTDLLVDAPDNLVIFVGMREEEDSSGTGTSDCNDDDDNNNDDENGVQFWCIHVESDNNGNDNNKEETVLNALSKVMTDTSDSDYCFKFTNLREVGDLLERQDAALLASANGLVGELICVELR